MSSGQKHRDLFVVSMVLFIATMLLKPRVMDRIDEIVDAEAINAKPLYDMTHRILPDLHTMSRTRDGMVVALVLVVGIYLTAIGQAAAIANVSFVATLAAFAKMFMNAVTIHPDPHPECAIRKAPTAYDHVFGRCNELMPSMHMLYPFTILYFTYGIVSPAAWYSIAAYTGGMLFVTLASRQHYAIDTIVSFLVVMAVAPHVDMS